MNVSPARQPSALIPIAMSIAALLTVLSHVAMFGIARETDEGAAAHIWQLLMAGQLPVVAFYAVKWLPRAPRTVLQGGSCRRHSALRRRTATDFAESQGMSEPLRLRWGMFPYDAALLSTVQASPQSVADVLQILQDIDAACIDGDGLKWFNHLYLQVTQAVEAQVSTGGFSDPVWLAQLDVQFASLYFSALRSSLSGQPASACWRVVFDSRNQPAIARIQFALAGVNAHINHDLAEAIVATCQVTGTRPDHGGTRYRDYTGLNSTLDSLVESAKRTLNVRLLGAALPPVSRLEDTIAAWNVSAARESAWQNAEHLWQLRTMPPLVSSFMDVLDGFTTVIGKTLLVQVP